MTLSELAYEQFRTLPESQAEEVLDFTGFLKQKQARTEWEDLMRAQTTAVKTFWDKPGNEVWNDL